MSSPSDPESNSSSDDDPRRQGLRPTTMDQRRDLPPPARKPSRKRGASSQRSQSRSQAGNTSGIEPNRAVPRAGTTSLTGGNVGNGGTGGGKGTGGTGVRGRGRQARGGNAEIKDASTTAAEDEEEEEDDDDDDDEQQGGVDPTSVLLYVCAALAVLVFALLVYRLMRSAPAASSDVGGEKTVGAAGMPDSQEGNKAGDRIGTANGVHEGGEVGGSSGTRRTTDDAKTVSVSQMNRKRNQWTEGTVTLHRP